MGLFKNEVGRPSNETIKKRNIFKGICVLLVIVVIGLVCYILNDKGIINLNNISKNTKEHNEKITVSEEEAKSILKKYSINDDIYFLTTEKFSDNYKVSLALSKTSAKTENNICEKVIKYFDITATKDISGNYPINNFGDYDFVYCSEDEKFYSSSDLEKNYEELFGKNASVPYIDIVNNSLEYKIFAYMKNLKGYVSLSRGIGDLGHGQAEYIYEAYKLNNEMHIVFSSFSYVDAGEEGKLEVYFSERINNNELKNNLSYKYFSDGGKIIGDVKQFFIDNREVIPVYEIILSNEDGNYIYKSMNKVK